MFSAGFNKTCGPLLLDVEAEKISGTSVQARLILGNAEIFYFVDSNGWHYGLNPGTNP